MVLLPMAVCKDTLGRSFHLSLLLPSVGQSTDHPFPHFLNVRRSFPACLKCAKTLWLEEQTSGGNKGLPVSRVLL